MSAKIGIYPSKENDLEFYTQALFIPIFNHGEFDWEVNNKKVMVDLKNIGLEYETNFRIVFNEFKNSSKIFDRHYKNSQQNDLIYRDLTILTIQLSEELKVNSVACVIFFTGSSHHIDSLICELACRIARIKQVFLYPVAMAKNRLIPMVQTNGIITRSNLNMPISSVKFTEEILEFPTLTLGNSNNYLSGFSQNLYYTVWNAFAFEIQKSVFKVLRNIVRTIKRKSIISNALKPISFFAELSLMLNQKRFLKVLDQFINIDSATVSSQSQVGNLVIFAHFEPESTNFPEGGELHNILDLVIRIRSLGYTGKIIYKEHFGLRNYSQSRHSLRSGIARSQSLYENLKSLGCLFVDTNYVPNDLSIVVTLVGTTALERSLSGKYTVVLGHIWYEGIPGTITLEKAIAFLQEPNSIMASNRIISDAKQFLCNCLNYKTINNARGIGTGKPSKDINDWYQFYEEVNRVSELFIV